MSSEAPEDDRAAVPSSAGRRHAHGTVPYVLQVSPIDTVSLDQDEFYYDPFADLESSDFAAARAFFLHHGHVVVFHDCPDAIAFQELFPRASIAYVSLLPDALISEGHRILAHQRALLQSSRQPSAISPPRSIVDRYVVDGFAGSRGGAPSPSTTTVSSSSESGLLQSPSMTIGGELRSSSISRGGECAPSVPAPPPTDQVLDRSHRPDLEGDVLISHNHYGGSRSSYGGPPPRYGGLGFPTSGSRSTGYSVYPFHRQGGHPDVPVPPIIYPKGLCQCLDHGSHASALIVSSLDETVSPLGSLLHPSGPLPSTSEITLAFSEFSVPSHVGVSPAQYGGPPEFYYGGSTVPTFGVPPAATPGFVPAAPAVPAPVAVPPPGVYRAAATPGPALPVPPSAAPSLGPSPALAPGPGSGPPPAPAPAPLPLVPPPAPIGPVRAELLKLDPIKDAKGFLDSLETIQFYLRMPEFSTGHADNSLTTDVLNVEASRAWEGQLRLAVKDGSLKFLFENKGSLYHGRRFKMLAALMQHCHPDSVSNAFSSLLSIFNNVQGDNESIIEYRSRFDGLTLELSRCKVTIPSFLMVMLFLRALHGRYSVIFEQYRSVIGHGIGGKYIPIMARLAKARRWSKQ